MRAGLLVILHLAGMAVAPPIGAAQPRRPLAFADLQSFTFDLGEHSSVEGGRVPLSGGRWKDPSEGGSTFTLLKVHGAGDLDRDGAGDVAGVVVESTPGAGEFSYLFAVLNQEGGPVQAGTPEWLGDRSRVERLSIDRKGILTVRFVTHKDGDPPCCPTMRIEDRFRIVDGRLVGIIR
jgi:hypothetical protein